MKLTSLSSIEIQQRLLGPGLSYRIGAFTVKLYSDLADFPELIHLLYAEYPLIISNDFADFHISIKRSRGFRRWLRPQVQLRIDGEEHFHRFPPSMTLPFLEWGINWCVYNRAHHYLMLHAGAVEKNGLTLLLPAHPGSGKSTLCAALINRGWRLLSDEFGLIRLADSSIVPFPKLIPLKNDAIGVIRSFIPDAVIGPEYLKTRKGTIAHLRPPAESIARSDEFGLARWIVFPKFKSGAELTFQPVTKTQAFLNITTSHAFNYENIGLRGFQAMTGLIDTCDCYSLEYSDLNQAIAQLDALLEGQV